MEHTLLTRGVATDTERVLNGGSPSLRYERWHAYDELDGEFTHQDRAIDLKAIAERVDEVCRGNYNAWHQRYADAAEALGARVWCTKTTDWRAVVGWSTNPALETGITLHRTLGFPYLPGSAIKGLLHHAAEGELHSPSSPQANDALTRPARDERLDDATAQHLLSALRRCRLVHRIFGSLTSTGLDKKSSPGVADLIEAWRELLQPRIERDTPGLSATWRETWEEIQCLSEPTGGILTCWDAVPLKQTAASSLSYLEVDVLTPHYDHYHIKKHLPTDDCHQKPNPVPFLVIVPGTAFEFRFRHRHLGTFPENPPSGVVESKVRQWLDYALSSLGIGAKTTAGYGYLSGQGPLPVAAPESWLGGPGSLPFEKPPWKPPNPDARKRAQQHLIGRDLASAIDMVVGGSALRDAEAQLELARLIHEIESHRLVIETWRKGSKKRARARVAWFDRLLSNLSEDE